MDFQINTVRVERTNKDDIEFCTIPCNSIFELQKYNWVNGFFDVFITVKPKKLTIHADNINESLQYVAR